jgi:hydrogenase expression/formation protein HypC
LCLGIPGRVVEITNRTRKRGLVDVSGIKREVNLAGIVNEEHSIDEAVGDWVLVDVGFAMSRIDEREAAATLEMLRKLGEVQAEHVSMRVPGRI